VLAIKGNTGLSTQETVSVEGNFGTQTYNNEIKSSTGFYEIES